MRRRLSALPLLAGVALLAAACEPRLVEATATCQNVGAKLADFTGYEDPDVPHVITSVARKNGQVQEDLGSDAFEGTAGTVSMPWIEMGVITSSLPNGTQLSYRFYWFKPDGTKVTSDWFDFNPDSC